MLNLYKDCCYCLKDTKRVPAPETNVMRLEALEQRLNMLLRVVCTRCLLLKSNRNYQYDTYVVANPHVSRK